MKLWHSFLKELKLASRGFYFYIEILMAGVFLFLLLFVIPENFESRQDEFLYYDVPEAALAVFEETLIDEDLDGFSEKAEFEIDDEIISGVLYQSSNNNFYVMQSEADALAIADDERAFAAIIHMDEVGEITYTYYMQGYETERLRNTYAVFHNREEQALIDSFEAQVVKVLHEDQVLLNDRQNVLPSFLTFNGSLMGMFILVAYIFLDKKEGVIKAYAVTPSPIWHYLLSKVSVVTFTSIVTSLIITLPIMGGQPNYLLMLVFLITSGFAASSVGLILASIYNDMMQSFGALYSLVILFMLPNIAYFIPTWNPGWIRYIPSYPMLEGFKEILLPGGDVSYILSVSLGYLLAGLALFLFATARFKKTLTL